MIIIETTCCSSVQQKWVFKFLNTRSNEDNMAGGKCCPFNLYYYTESEKILQTDSELQPVVHDAVTELYTLLFS